MLDLLLRQGLRGLAKDVAGDTGNRGFGGEMSVEVHDKRFGVVAVEKGFVTKEQLFEALQTQIEEELNGDRHSLIGIILVRLGYLMAAQADEILGIMKKR